MSYVKNNKGNLIHINWNNMNDDKHNDQNQIIHSVSVILDTKKSNNKMDDEYLNKTTNIITGDMDKIIDELLLITKKEPAKEFTYLIKPNVELNNKNKYQEYYELILGDFIWELINKYTNEKYDERLSQITDEIYEKIDKYLLSIGWTLKVYIYENENVINFSLINILPSQYNNFNFMSFDDINSYNTIDEITIDDNDN